MYILQIFPKLHIFHFIWFIITYVKNCLSYNQIHLICTFFLGRVILSKNQRMVQNKEIKQLYKNVLSAMLIPIVFKIAKQLEAT